MRSKSTKTFQTDLAKSKPIKFNRTLTPNIHDDDSTLYNIIVTVADERNAGTSALVNGI